MNIGLRLEKNSTEYTVGTRGQEMSMKTRRAVFVAIILLLTVGSSGVAMDRLLSVSCDLFLAIRLGVESRFHPQMGVRADMGWAFYGLLLADVFYVVYLMPEESRFRVNLLFGIPTISTPITLEAAMVSFGASLAAGYRFTDTFGMDLRLGAGFPLFFERGKEVIRPVRIPLFIPYLWPDLTLSANFRLPKRN
jgi:hypothetical protein